MDGEIVLLEGTGQANILVRGKPRLTVAFGAGVGKPNLVGRRPGIRAGENLVASMAGRAGRCPLVPSGQGVAVETLREVLFQTGVARGTGSLGVLRMWELHVLVA